MHSLSTIQLTGRIKIFIRFSFDKYFKKSFIQQRIDVKHDLNVQIINFCTRSKD